MEMSIKKAASAGSGEGRPDASIRALFRNLRFQPLECVIFLDRAHNAKADPVGVVPPDALRYLRVFLLPIRNRILPFRAAAALGWIDPTPAAGHVMKAPLARQLYRKQRRLVQRK